MGSCKRSYRKIQHRHERKLCTRESNKRTLCEGKLQYVRMTPFFRSAKTSVQILAP